MKKWKHIQQNEKQDIWECRFCGKFHSFPRSMGYNGGPCDSQYPEGHDDCCEAELSPDIISMYLHDATSILKNVKSFLTGCDPEEINRENLLKEIEEFENEIK